MKCPRCGAEINNNSKFCQSCGSQISYQMQREQELLNIKGCPKCNSSNVQFTRENQGEVRNKQSKQIIHRTVGFCKDCGYTWYPNADYENSKKNNTIWWVLGWLFFFPIPVMILIWRKQNKWSTKTKIIATVVFWILLFVIRAINNNSAPTTKLPVVNTPDISGIIINDIGNDIASSSLIESSEGEDEENVLVPTVSGGVISDFVTAFNSASFTPLIYTESFTPSDENNKHYRVEFRLNAYKDAIGEVYSYGDQTVEIISREDIFNNKFIRVYMSGASFNECLEVIKIASPILDGSLSDSELQLTLDYLSKNKSANGYYYSNLGLNLLGNVNSGYNLMLKMKSD